MTSDAILVIDIGGTNAKFAAIRGGQQLPERRQFPTATLRESGDPVEGLARLIGTIGAELLGKVDTVVATIPGFLDPDRDLVRFAGNVPEFNGRRVAHELSTMTGIPVVLERDAVMSLKGEWKAGAGKGVKNLLGLFFGTGVGGAFLCDGAPFRGSGFALEIGNMPFKGEGREMAGLRKDCLEAYVSGRVLHEIADRHAVPIEEIFLRADQAPSLNLAIDGFVKDQAIAIGIAYSLFSPDAILIGGGICEMRGFPMERLTALVAANSTARELQVDLDLRRATLGWGAVLHGAQMVAAEQTMHAGQGQPVCADQ